MLRISRKIVLAFAIGAGVMLTSSPLQATRYGYCWVTYDKYYYTGIIEVAEEGGIDAYGPWAQAFLNYVKSTYNPKAERTECYDWRDFDTANEWVRKDRELDVVRTGWTGNLPQAVDRKEDRPRYRDGDLILTLPGQKVKDAPAPGNSEPAKKQWEIEYEAKMAKWQQEMELNRQQVAAAEKAKAEFEATKARQAEEARKVQEKYERDRAAWLRLCESLKARGITQCPAMTTSQ